MSGQKNAFEMDSVSLQSENEINQEMKIVIVGDVGAGKSTAIKTISEIPFVNSEVIYLKMVYGIAVLDEAKLHLFSAPGERRFDFMAAALCMDAHGIIIMVNLHSDDPLVSLDYYLNQYRHFLKKQPDVIAMTYSGDIWDTSLHDYQSYVLRYGFTCKDMLVNHYNKNDVEQTLRAMPLNMSSRLH